MLDQQAAYRRHSLRLRHYNYAQAGAYFVTICAQDRACLFGEAVDDQVLLHDPGEMVVGWWEELPRKFPRIEVDDAIVMPNHVHGIVLINHDGTNPGSAAEGASLGAIVGWFKTMTTNAYIRGVRASGWQPFSRRLWQINYFEHIIRNERSHERIRRYIYANPSRWPYDEENSQRARTQ